MAPRIKVENISKCYRIGQQSASGNDPKYRMLRDVLMDAIKAPIRNLRSGAALGRVEELLHHQRTESRAAGRRFRGLTAALSEHPEAAEILAVPLGTIMSRLYRGRARIERALLSYGKRYNYLSQRPAKVRDTAITEEVVDPRTD